MLKSGLVRRLAEQNPHLHLKDAQKIVDAIFDEVTAALARVIALSFADLAHSSCEHGRLGQDAIHAMGLRSACRRSFIRLSRLVRKCTID
jgi:hypothetical protein